jgi:hypothetical protein
MAAQDLFPTDITPAEETAGFRLTDFPSPDARYFGYPKTVRAVVYRIDASYCLVKQSPQTGIKYNLYLYGVFHQTPNVEPAWTPITFDHNESDPNVLVERVAQWIKHNPNPHYLVRTAPAFPNSDV